MDLENIKLMLDIRERYALNILTNEFNRHGLSLDQATSAYMTGDTLTVCHKDGTFWVEVPNAQRCHQVLQIVRGWDLA